MKLATFKIIFIVEEQSERTQRIKISTLEKYIKFVLKLIGLKNIDVISEFKEFEEGRCSW